MLIQSVGVWKKREIEPEYFDFYSALYFAYKELHWTDEQFWRSTPKLFFALLDVPSQVEKAAEEKDGPKYVEYYDDLPPGFW